MARNDMDYQHFVEQVWPKVVERLGLEEDAEPTDEEYELWESQHPDEKDYHEPDCRDSDTSMEG